MNERSTSCLLIPNSNLGTIFEKNMLTSSQIVEGII